MNWWINLPWSAATLCVVLMVIAFCVVYLVADALRAHRAKRRRRQLAEVSGVVSLRVARAYLRAVRGD